MSLTHKYPECTGRWSFRSVNGTPYWKCDRCGAIGYATDVNRAVAVEENLAGIRLEQLTREGRKLLEGA